MPRFATSTRLLAALGCALPLLAAAQAASSALSAAEQRAQRETERVFSFIKFQTVRSRPVTEPATKTPRPTAPKPERPADKPQRLDAAATPPATDAAPVQPAAAPVSAEPQPAAAELVVAPASVEVKDAAPASPAPAPEAASDEPDEAPLRLVNFVAPALSPEMQASLGVGDRRVKLRFQVEANGTVSSAEAAAGVPRRLAKYATEAVLQWRFTPLPQPRTVDVEIAFRRD